MESTIVFKKRELLVVEDFWKKALEARPTAFSFMSSNGKTLRCEINEGKLDMETIMEIQQEHLSKEVFFWLMKADKYKEEDVQPFICFGDENATIIAGMSDGEFKNFSPSASEHSNDYFLFNKYIIPKLNTLGKDRDAIFNNLANDLTSMEIKQMLGDIGTIVLLGDNGRNVTFSNHTQNEYEWGWASNGHGHTEKKEEKPKSGIVRRVLSSVARPIAETKPIVQPPKTETATVLHTAEALEEWHEFTPPKGLSNKALKSIYKRVCNGTLPANWRDRPTVKYKKTIGVKPPADIKEKPTIVKDFKDIPKDVATAVTTDSLPILSPTVIESFEHEFMKDLDKQSTTIPSPEKILEDMKEMPDFWEQNAYDKKYTDAWVFEKFLELGQKQAKALAILCWNYRNLLLLSDNQEDEVVEPDTSGTGVLAEADEPAWKKKMRKKRAAKAM